MELIDCIFDKLKPTTMKKYSLVFITDQNGVKKTINVDGFQNTNWIDCYQEISDRYDNTQSRVLNSLTPLYEDGNICHFSFSINGVKCTYKMIEHEDLQELIVPSKFIPEFSLN